MKFYLLKQAVIGPQVPMAVFENLYSSKENDLKVILYVLNKGEIEPLDIARNLDISMASVQSSLLYWTDKGIIMAEDEQQSKPKKKKRLSARDILAVSDSHPEIEIMVNRLQKIYGQAIIYRLTLYLYLRAIMHRCKKVLPIPPGLSATFSKRKVSLLQTRQKNISA